MLSARVQDRALPLGLVTTSYPAFDGDYRGAFVAARVQELVAAGQTVEVLAAGAVAGEQQGPPADVRVLRLPSPLFAGAGAPELLDATLPSTRLFAHTEALRFALALLAKVSTRAPRWSRVESHWLVPSALAVTMAAPALPHVAYCHSGDLALLERTSRVGSVLARWLLARCQEVVCVSDDLRTRLLRLACADTASAARVCVRRLPLSPAFEAAAPVAPAVPGTFLISAGRLVPIKGFDVLILALGRLPVARRPPLVLLGDGPERARLARLAVACGVELVLPGIVSHAAVAAWLRRAALCVVPSRKLASGRSEGLPMIAREALSLGTPVIASRSGGLAELGEGVTLVAPNEPAALAAEVLRALHTRPRGA